MVMQMYGIKSYVVTVINGEYHAKYYFDSHLLGMKLQANLFDPTINPKEAEILRSPTPFDFSAQQPKEVEEV
jgi:hypothetical protein